MFLTHGKFLLTWILWFESWIRNTLFTDVRLFSTAVYGCPERHFHFTISTILTISHFEVILVVNLRWLWKLYNNILYNAFWGHKWRMEKLSSGPKLKCEKILHDQLNNVKYLANFHVFKGAIILICNLRLKKEISSKKEIQRSLNS